jgi:protein-S-isoprenylcysteine O-methyltransferase Ste14
MDIARVFAIKELEHRISREERFLERNFNDQYSSHKAQVRRSL